MLARGLGSMLPAIMALPALAFGAPQGAAVMDDGYAGAVLQKILGKGSINIGKRLDVILSLDDEGNLIDCRAARGGDAKAVCAQAKAASPFGTPPYGVPVKINLALWNGQEPASHQTEKATPSPGQSKYLDQIRRQMRNAMYIPTQTKPGVYHATARVKIDKNGKILESALTKGSGDKMLDKYVLQGIKRAAKVAPPPGGNAETVDVTFTLTRM